MGLVAQSVSGPAVPAGIILVFRVVVGVFVVEVCPAIGAFQIPGKNILVKVFCLAELGVPKGLLYALPFGPGDDRLMHVFMYLPFFRGIVQAGFQLIGFAVCAEVYHVPHIKLVGQDISDHAGVPQVFAACGLHRGILKSLSLGVDGWDKYLVPLQYPRYVVDAGAVGPHGIDAAHDLRALRVDDPMLRFLRVVHIAQGRAADGVALLALGAERGAHFTAHVLGVPLVHNVTERGKIVLALVAVHAVIHGDEAYTVHRENRLRKLSHFQVVPAQPGHILYNDRGDLVGFDKGHHLLKTVPLHRHAGNAVVYEYLDILKSVPLGIVRQERPLVGDLSRGFSA